MRRSARTTTQDVRCGARKGSLISPNPPTQFMTFVGFRVSLPPKPPYQGGLAWRPALRADRLGSFTGRLLLRGPLIGAPPTEIYDGLLREVLDFYEGPRGGLVQARGPLTGSSYESLHKEGRRKGLREASTLALTGRPLTGKPLQGDLTCRPPETFTGRLALTGRLLLRGPLTGAPLTGSYDGLLREVLTSSFTEKDDEKAYGKPGPSRGPSRRPLTGTRRGPLTGGSYESLHKEGRRRLTGSSDLSLLWGPLREDPLRGRLLTGRLNPYEKAPYGEGRSSLRGGFLWEGGLQRFTGRLLTRRSLTRRGGPYGKAPFWGWSLTGRGSFDLSPYGGLYGKTPYGEGSLREG